MDAGGLSPEAMSEVQLARRERLCHHSIMRSNICTGQGPNPERHMKYKQGRFNVNDEHLLCGT